MRQLIEHALAEDVGSGDVTTAAVLSPEARARARIVQREPGVIACLDVACEVFRTLDPALRWHERAVEGVWRDEPGAIAEVVGAAAPILTGERTALNLLGRLGGIATLTRRFVDAVAGTGAVILDTRKTTPGMRALEKRAVLAGGGQNHRQGLYDAILIKENHVALAGGVAEALARALAAEPELPIEIECRDLAEVEASLGAGAERVLLDNMAVEDIARAVRLGDGRARFEASGGVTLANVRAVAEAGVDFISVGALTHSAPALDLSLLLEPL